MSEQQNQVDQTEGGAELTEQRQEENLAGPLTDEQINDGLPVADEDHGSVPDKLEEEYVNRGYSLADADELARKIEAGEEVTSQQDASQGNVDSSAEDAPAEGGQLGEQDGGMGGQDDPGEAAEASEGDEGVVYEQGEVFTEEEGC